jgi:hypothetical protein
MGGYEFVMTTAADYAPTPVSAAKPGFCCVPGLYGTNSCATLSSVASTAKSSKVWTQREIALANCPNLTTHCGATQKLDLDLTDFAAQTVTVGATAVKLTKNDACSYIAVSKCKAPTVDFAIPTSTDSLKEKLIYNISYLEYSMVSAASTLTEFNLDVA